MSLRNLVKLSAVNNLSDARYGAGMGVELMGFPLDRDSGVSIEKYEEITSWVSGPSFVAEFDHPDVNRLLEVISACHPDYIEIGQGEFIHELPHITIPVILRWNMADLDSVPKHLDVAYLLIESDQDEKLSSEQMKQIRELCSDYKVLLGTGITPENVLSLIEEIPVAGISLKGGEEIRAGYKDYDTLADILELMEED